VLTALAKAVSKYAAQRDLPMLLIRIDNTYMSVPRVLTLFLLLSLGLSALAQGPQTVPATDQNQPPASSSGVVEPKPVPAKDDDHSQEAFVVEKIQRQYRFENDGTGSSTVTARVRVQTQAGVQQLGQLVWGYNSANEKMDINYVRVSKPDGSNAVTTPPQNIQDVPSQIERDAPSYTDYRERHITVPALRPGEILEYQIKTTTLKPLIPKHFWLDHVFNQDVITLDEQLSVDIPKDRKIKLKNKAAFSPKVEEKNGRKIYTWANKYTKRESEEELKKKRLKQQREDWAPDVMLTTFSSWEELGQWYAGLQRSQIELTPELRAEVERLTKDAKTEEEKIQAIYDFVAQQYRYVSLSFGVGRYQPHPASEVFGKKYGDCKDKHTLFTTMLRALDFNVEPILIGSQRKLDVDVPSPSQFDHVISAVLPRNAAKNARVEPIYWADTTTEIAPFGLLTYNIRKKKALLVGLNQSPRIVETPPDPPFQSTQRMEVVGSISDLGKIKGNVKATYRGDYELALRSVLRNTAQNKWKDVAKYLAMQIGVGGGDVENVKVENLTDTHKPLYMEFDVARANYLDWANKSTDLRIPLPIVTMAPTAGLADDGNILDDDDDGTPDAPSSTTASAAKKAEEKPISLGSPFDLTVRAKLTLPPNYKPRVPVPVAVKRDYAEYKSSYKVDGATLLVERTMNLRSREIPAERKTDYAAFVRSVRADEKQKFYLENTAAAKGAPELPAEIKTEEVLESAREALQSQNYRIARDLLQRVAQKEPKNKYVYNLLGEAYMGLREFTQAESTFKKQIGLDAFDSYAHAALGRAYYQQRKLEDSAAAFQKQLEIEPLDANTHAAIAEVYLELNKYQEASEAMEKCVSLDPQNGFYHANLGRAYLKLKREKEAVEAFDKAVELRADPMLWNNIAYELADNDSNLDRAEQYAESAVSQISSALRNVSINSIALRDIASVTALGSFWDTLGWVAFKRGDLDKAERYITAAWQLTQGSEVGDHLAQIYAKRGKTQDAVTQLAKAVNGNRPKREARERLNSLVKDQAKAEKLVAEFKPVLEKERTFTLNSPGQKQGTADFFVLVSQSGTVEGAKFISGNEALKPLEKELASLNYNAIFPDNTPTKVVRRGSLNCENGSCKFVLMDPETITSVN
jgi:Flp pilus assembly protein TadD